jgi:cytochrome c biogenesis protein CcdA
MRAICGAIITAGSLIGLGLLSIGIGTRYGNLSTPKDTQTGILEYIPLKSLDSAFLISMTVLVLFALIGLGIAFVGLAYHHHRRYHEHLRATQANSAGSARITV